MTIIADRRLGEFLDHKHDDRITSRASSPGTKLTARTVVARDERFLLVDASRGSVLVVLPRAEEGRLFMVKRTDNILTNRLVISDSAGNTIDGKQTWELFTQYAVASVVFTQGAWFVLQSGPVTNVRPSTYSATNVTTDRAYDANATTVDELADVLGTLISDLRSDGIVY